MAALALLALGCERGREPRSTWPVWNEWRGAPAPSRDAGTHAATFARAMVGRPYCWGGEGPHCFDCSGLTYAAWRAAGRVIPRTSEAQRARLMRVALAEVRAGDIVWRPGHVGVYIGDGWVVHAPRTGEPVRYQPAHRYVEALRP